MHVFRVLLNAARSRCQHCAILSGRSLSMRASRTEDVPYSLSKKAGRVADYFEFKFFYTSK